MSRHDLSCLAFGNTAVEQRVDALSEEQAVTVLRKLAVMHQDAIAMFQDGVAEDQAWAEGAKLAVTEEWLPAMTDKHTVHAWIKQVINKAVDIDNVGKIVGALMKAHKQKMERAMAQRLVKGAVAKARCQQWSRAEHSSIDMAVQHMQQLLS